MGARVTSRSDKVRDNIEGQGYIKRSYKVGGHGYTKSSGKVGGHGHTKRSDKLGGQVTLKGPMWGLRADVCMDQNCVTIKLHAFFPRSLTYDLWLKMSDIVRLPLLSKLIWVWPTCKNLDILAFCYQPFLWFSHTILLNISKLPFIGYWSKVE